MTAASGGWFPWLRMRHPTPGNAPETWPHNRGWIAALSLVFPALRLTATKRSLSRHCIAVTRQCGLATAGAAQQVGVADAVARKIAHVRHQIVQLWTEDIKIARRRVFHFRRQRHTDHVVAGEALQSRIQLSGDIVYIGRQHQPYANKLPADNSVAGGSAVVTVAGTAPYSQRNPSGNCF